MKTDRRDQAPFVVEVETADGRTEHLLAKAVEQLERGERIAAPQGDVLDRRDQLRTVFSHRYFSRPSSA